MVGTRTAARPIRRALRRIDLPGGVLGLGACLLVVLLGCGSGSRFQGEGSEGKFQNGKELYERGRCFQAAEVFQTFLSEHPGSARVDDAIYYLGLSRKCLGEYILAREEFDRLLREFPQSENREEAEWSRALCFYESRHSADRDPEPTEQAIRALRSYLSHYPNGVHRDDAEELIRASNELLARKEYENGRTYVMLRRWQAAAIYFEKSLEILPESSVAPKAYLGMVRSQAEQGKVAETREWMDRLESFATAERRERYGDDLESSLAAGQDWIERAAKVEARMEAERARREKEALPSPEAAEQAAGSGP